MRFPVVPVVLLALAHASPVFGAAAGDAVRNAGGSTFSGRAADAIQETCLDLVAAGDEINEVQNDLRTNCGNMVGTTIGWLGRGNADNPYGFSNDDDVYSAIRQFSGEETTSEGRNEANNKRQFSSIGKRLSAIRTGNRAASGVTFNLQGVDVVAQSTDQQATPMTGGAAGSGGEYGWGWFANLEYGFGDRDATENENKLDFDAYELTAGADYAWSTGWVAGFAIGYNDNKVKFDTPAGAVTEVSGGSLDSDGFTAAGFFQAQGDPLYLNGILSYRDLGLDMSRRVSFTNLANPNASPDRTMKSSTDSRHLEGELKLGTILGDAAWTFDVYGGVNFLNIEIDSFEEVDTTQNGGLALRFGDQSIDSLQSVLGFVAQRVINTDSGVVIPYLGAAWRHEFNRDTRTVNARYAEAIDPNASNIDFRMPTDEPDSDYVELTFGVSSQLKNALFLFFQWEAAAGLENTSAHLLTAGVRGIF